MSDSQSTASLPPASETPLLARLTHRAGAFCPWPVILGILGIQIGLWAPMVGFAGYFLSLLMGLAAVILGVVFLLRTRGSGATEARGVALTGLAIGGAMLAVGLVSMSPGRGLPRINDITTDVDNPPEFLVLLANRNGDPLAYPEEFAPLVREAYPDLQPIHLRVPGYIAHQRAVRAGTEMGWKIVGQGELDKVEATATSQVFRFQDDIVVRIQPDGTNEEYSIVDIRSRSRDGRGDLGVNAARIRRFRGLL